MLNLGRNDRWVDLKDSSKPDNKPAVSSAQQPNVGGATARTPSTPSTPGVTVRDPQPPRDQQPPRDATPPIIAAPSTAAPVPSPEEKAGSKLFVGVNIKLKGVEISNCDVLVIEGQVDATVNSKVMEISKPGTLSGTAVIDIAEIHGEFSGEITARTKLVVHGTGRVTGTVRYGKLVVAEGGTVTGELKQIEAASKETGSVSVGVTPDARSAASPAPAH